MEEKFIYLTLEWLGNLKSELEHLKNTKRVEVAEKLKEAIEYWDLSENSEYEEARNEQALIEKRILDIEEQLKNVKLIDSEDNKNKNIVKMWSIITIEKIWDKLKETYKIVWTTESSILWDEPKISNESPIWKLLLWKKKWTTIKLKTKEWVNEYKILEIK